MAQLAIKGHKTRGKEVIEIFKMLGGKIRRDRLVDNELCYWYYINGDGDVWVQYRFKQVEHLRAKEASDFKELYKKLN